MTLETNKIKEVAPGIFWVLLWCPESSILSDLLNPNAGYVLCWDHLVGNYSWREFRLPLLNPEDEPINVTSRILSLDFILPTDQFLQLLPGMDAAIKAVQLFDLPPDYLDMKRVRGKQLYRILGECGWHVLLDTPGNDYGEVMSPDREVLERAVEIARSLEPR